LALIVGQLCGKTAIFLLHYSAVDNLVDVEANLSRARIERALAT
jgi:hypothetical protein